MILLYNPEDDLDNAHIKLFEDSETLSLMGLAGQTDDVISEHILKRSQWDDLAGDEIRLNIYFRPSRMTRNPIVIEVVLQIDCHVPAKQDYIAWRIQKRITNLLHKYQIGTRIYYFDGMLGELPTMPGFFCAGSRFCCYPTI